MLVALKPTQETIDIVAALKGRWHGSYAMCISLSWHCCHLSGSRRSLGCRAIPTAPSCSARLRVSTSTMECRRRSCARSRTWLLPGHLRRRQHADCLSD